MKIAEFHIAAIFYSSISIIQHYECDVSISLDVYLLEAKF